MIITILYIKQLKQSSHYLQSGEPTQKVKTQGGSISDSPPNAGCESVTQFVARVRGAIHRSVIEICAEPQSVFRAERKSRRYSRFTTSGFPAVSPPCLAAILLDILNYRLPIYRKPRADEICRSARTITFNQTVGSRLDQSFNRPILER